MSATFHPRELNGSDCHMESIWWWVVSYCDPIIDRYVFHASTLLAVSGHGRPIPVTSCFLSYPFSLTISPFSLSSSFLAAQNQCRCLLPINSTQLFLLLGPSCCWLKTSPCPHRSCILSAFYSWNLHPEKSECSLAFRVLLPEQQPIAKEVGHRNKMNLCAFIIHISYMLKSHKLWSMSCLWRLLGASDLFLWYSFSSSSRSSLAGIKEYHPLPSSLPPGWHDC